MSRRRKDNSLLDELFELLLLTPIWVGPILAGGTFALFRWGVPWWLGTLDTSNQFNRVYGNVIGPIAVAAAPYVTAVVLLLWVIAEFRKWADRRRLDKQTGVESIRGLGWREFESLLAEAFRREGYQVEQLGGSSPDGGVDLRLRRAGEVTLVQCKQWRNTKVGVAVVRELKGVMATQGAHGIVVTSGNFTSDAADFARNAGIRTIDGDTLAEMIQAAQRNPPTLQEAPSAIGSVQPLPATPACPKCGSAMILRTASRGANAGSKFWGCSSYPRCKGIVNVVG